MLKVISIIPTAVPDGVSVAVPRKNEPGGAARDEVGRVREGASPTRPHDSHALHIDLLGIGQMHAPMLCVCVCVCVCVSV